MIIIVTEQGNPIAVNSDHIFAIIESQDKNKAIIYVNGRINFDPIHADQSMMAIVEALKIDHIARIIQ